MDNTFKFLFGNKLLYETKNDLTIYGPGIIYFEIVTKIGNCKVFMTATPLNAFSMKAVFHILSPSYIGWFAKFNFWAIYVNAERDRRIWNWKQYKMNPLLTKEEKVIKLFKNWYSGFYSESSKTFEMARQDLSW